MEKMDKILAQDQYDQSGFLVGPSTEDDIEKTGREIDILRAIHGDTQETVEQLARIADGLGPLVSGQAPAVTAARVVGEQGGDEPRQSPLHAAPAEPGRGDERAQDRPEAAAPLSPQESPATAVHSQADLSALPAINVQLPAFSEPGRASVQLPSQAKPREAPPGAAEVPPAGATPAAPERVPLPPTGKPAIADPHVAAIEKAAKESKRQDPERQRQANGRFASSRDQDDPTGADDPGQSKSGDALEAASESLKNAARGMADGADNIDPTVQAAKEIGAVVSPVLGVVKPLAGLFGSKRSTPEEKRHRTNLMWYRRIWGALKDDKGKSRLGMMLTGLMAVLGMLLAPIKALARMTGLLRGLAAMGGMLKAAGGLMGRRGAGGRPGRPGRDGRPGRTEARGRAEARERGARTRNAEVRAERTASQKNAPSRPGAPPDTRKPASAGEGATSTNNTKAPNSASSHTDGNTKGAKSTDSTTSTKTPESRPGKLSRIGGRLGGVAKGLAKRVPVLGAVLGLGAIASTAMAKEDPNATPEQRQQAKSDRYGTYGSVAGGALGAILGMAGGPAGAIAGGMLGEQLGETVGTWLATVDLGGMVDAVSATFMGLAKSTSDQASKAFDFVKAKWDSLIATGTGALTGMMDWAKEKWTAATDKIASISDTIADKLGNARQAVSDGASSIKDAGQNALNKITGGRYTGGSNARKDELIKAMDAGGITDAKSKAALMANVDHESAGFTQSEENLNYSAKRLQQIFPKYYATAEAARADAGNPEAIANRVYGGRMGNTDPGDGYKYRGRGDIQLTGKAQYEAMGKKLGVDLVNNPDLASDPKYRAQIAVQHWKDSGANAAAIRGDIQGARVKTNGGTNGLADVNAKYDQYLAQAKAGDLTPTRRADQVRVAAPAAAAGAIADTMAKVKGQSTVVPGVTASRPVPAAGPIAAAAIPGKATAPAQAEPAKPMGMIPLANMHAAPASAVPTAGAAPGAVPPAKVVTAAPAPLVMAPMPTYSAPAPDASTVKVPSTPSVAKPMLGSSSKAAPPPQAPMVLSQDLEDRRIAHAATGGLGGPGFVRM